MSLRASTRLATSITPILKPPRTPELRSTICPTCLWRLQRNQLPLPFRRRPLATAAAEKPLELDPPPRNAGVPNTSITSTTAADAREREAQRAGRPPPPIQNPAQESTTQHKTPSQPNTTPNATAPTPNTTPRKSKLRPRKSALTLTPRAVSQLHALFAQPDPKLIRIGVKNRGCSGLAYHLEYVETAGRFDEWVEQEGVRVLIDSKALFSIIGSEMDWVEDKLSARFVFRNPNITEQCGCGESFSVG